MAKTKSRISFQKHADWKAAEVSLDGAGPKTFFALDRSEEALVALRETIGEGDARGGASRWQLVKRDVFAEEPLRIIGRLAVVCNPPYGERLKLTAPPKEYYKKLMDRLASYQPTAIGLILPKKFEGILPERHSGYRLQKTFEFKNGGLPVVYGIWTP